MRLADRLTDCCADWPAPVYCVGGCVRDRLLGRPHGDLDLVTRDARDLARRLADAAHAAFVVLHDGRGTARVVRRGQDWVDFAEQQGDIANDLRLRDFTVNAIACTLEQWAADEPRYLDPTGGRADLAAGVLRAVGPESLAADPLRVLRAHRLAALLGFTIEPGTAEWARRAAPGLADVAAERVLQEWLPLLGADRAAEAVAGLERQGVLAVLLPGAEDCAERARLLEPWLAAYRARPRLGEWLTRGERTALVRFAALLGSSSAAGAEAAALARRFALSRQQRRAVSALRQPVPAGTGGEIDRPGLAAWLLEHGPEAVGGVAVAAASGARDEAACLAALELLETVLLPLLAARPLITGLDLAQVLSLTPGPVYKTILSTVRLEQLTGALRDREDALARAREIVGSHGG